MNIVKLLGEDIQLSTTPSIVPGIDGVGAEYVLLQHDHTAGQAHKVIVKDDSGNITGCFHLAPHNPIIVKKERTETMEVINGVQDIYGTSVVHMG
jgi:hypothetical protein